MIWQAIWFRLFRNQKKKKKPVWCVVPVGQGARSWERGSICQDSLCPHTCTYEGDGVSGVTSWVGRQDPRVLHLLQPRGVHGRETEILSCSPWREGAHAGGPLFASAHWPHRIDGRGPLWSSGFGSCSSSHGARGGLLQPSPCSEQGCPTCIAPLGPPCSRGSRGHFREAESGPRRRLLGEGVLRYQSQGYVNVSLPRGPSADRA